MQQVLEPDISLCHVGQDTVYPDNWTPNEKGGQDETMLLK